jgi:hypothetical protein
MTPEETNAKMIELVRAFVVQVQNLLGVTLAGKPLTPFNNAEDFPGYVPPVEPDVEFYTKDGQPYDCKSGNSWMYRDPKTGEWWAGNFSIDHHSHGSAKIRQPEEMMKDPYYAWMAEPGPGTLNIYKDPEFLKQLEKGWNE